MDFHHVVWVCVWLLPVIAAKDDCPRDKSRVITRVVQEDLMPLYDEVKAPMPRECPFNPQRSMYGPQEDHKIEENQSRWSCNYCGKAFIDERFLDLHFENRHPEFVRTGSDSICLADHCDIFRCDLELKISKPGYWDRLLCREADLRYLQGNCNDTFTDCVPKFLIGQDRRIFLEKIQGAVCGFLTCSRYYTVRHEQPHPLNVALYIFLAMIVGTCLIIYYYVACTHFFSDQSILENWKEEENYSLVYRYEGQEVRQRHRHYHRPR